MTKEVEEALRRWAGSIECFVEEAIRPTKGISEQQRKVLQDIDNGYKDISVKSGHGTGKTTVMAWIILWVGLFKYDAKIPITAPTSAQLTRLLLPEVKKWQKQLPLELRDSVEVLSDRITFANDNFGIPRTARKGESEGLQGFHATFLLWIIDEASGVSDEVFEVVEGSLTGENYLRILMANPTRTVGYFYNTHNKNKRLWRTHTFNAEESQNVSKESIERKKEEYGEDSDAYRVRVLGEFPLTNTDSLLTANEIYAAMRLKPEDVDRTGVFTYACDVARYGSDNSVRTKKRGYDIYDLKEWSGLSTMEYANIIARDVDAETSRPDAIFVDTIGVGAGVMDRLFERGFTAIDANVSMKADKLDVYQNKRAEMYFNLRDFIRKGGRIPYDEELAEELQVITYSYAENSGKIQLMKKQEIKEELGRSPDKADSVALHFFSVIIPQDNIIYPTAQNGGGWMGA
jgi:phage terminase large subunit